MVHAALTNAVVASLETAPQIILGLVGEISSEILTRRPHLGKWSAHEHAVHLAKVHQLFFERLDLMLREDNPFIKSYEPGRDDEDGALLKIDLDNALQKFASDRQRLVEKLKTLAPTAWERTGRHEEYSHYSIFIMFRHLALHDHLHAYRIEEILLKKDWD